MLNGWWLLNQAMFRRKAATVTGGAQLRPYEEIYTAIITEVPLTVMKGSNTVAKNTTHV